MTDWPFIKQYERQAGAALITRSAIANNAPSEFAASAARALADEFTSAESRLRRLRRHLLADIAQRNLDSELDGWQTIEQLSVVADVLLEHAVQVAWAENAEKHGEPATPNGERLALGVIAMGKLGGRELNFSSDIDIIFVSSGSDGETAGNADGRRQISASEFFIKVAQRTIALLEPVTPDGFVYRVDTRLRPFGNAGPLVVSTDSLENYYAAHGRPWERYALIKARAVVDPSGFVSDALKALVPFVYRRYLDFTALESLRSIRDDIADDVARIGGTYDLKRGAGGIREAEFVVQALQIIRGGSDVKLQTASWRKALHRLVATDALAADEAQALEAAYLFLRQVENRVQMWADQQTHKMPTDSVQQAALAASFGLSDFAQLEAQLQRHRTVVTQLFDTVIGARDAVPLQDKNKAFWGDSARRESWLLDIGLPEQTSAVVEAQTQALSRAPWTQTGRQAIDGVWPRMLEHVAGLPLLRGSDDVIVELADLLLRLAGRTTYLLLLAERPAAIEQVVKLVGASPMVAQELKQSPELLDELLDSRVLYKPVSRAELSQDLADAMATAQGEEAELDALRRFQARHSLRIAAAELAEAVPLMRVSDHLSDVAEVCVEQALLQASSEMIERHGSLNDTQCTQAGEADAAAAPFDSSRLAELGSLGLGVIAYGKLGGLELNYGSDLDLVFLHNSDNDSVSDGKRALPAGQYWIRLVQRLMHWLNTRTSAGRAYEVDTRLRPSGNAGLLVTTTQAFATYQAQRAWTWEHQALVRARFVAGDASIAIAFNDIRRDILCQQRDTSALARDVVEMREKLRSQWLKPVAGKFDLKQGAGGIMDLEFLVQFLVLRHAHAHPAVAEYSDNVRQAEALGNAGILGQDEAVALKDAYLAFRAALHKMTLAGVERHVADTELSEHRACVSQLWTTHLGNSHQPEQPG